jgi:hypothetical protein
MKEPPAYENLKGSFLLNFQEIPLNKERGFGNRSYVKQPVLFRIFCIVLKYYCVDTFLDTRGARWPHSQSARRALAEVKQRS